MWVDMSDEYEEQDPTLFDSPERRSKFQILFEDELLLIPYSASARYP
jgi:hypothetical protein